MFHRIISLLLIVFIVLYLFIDCFIDSLSYNFNRLSVPFDFIVHEHRLQE